MSFTVPTGNFGDIFAGYVAERMGLPIDRLVIATNVNDILARTLATGTTDVARSWRPRRRRWTSRCRRISSACLFEATGRDAAAVAP
jgi:threonine synthase